MSLNVPVRKSYQKINGELMKKEIKAKYKTAKRFAELLGCSSTCVNESLRRGYMSKGYVVISCQLLDRPADYYNEVEEIEQTETPSNDDLADAIRKLTGSVERIESLLTFIYNKM